MARNRWTLALIIICLSILATVITAFRVRDLPKAQDSSKLQTKRPLCDHCDVKVSHEVHSDKIESDNREPKNLLREKHPLKFSKTKSNHKYDVRSDEDDDDDDLDFSNIQTGFRQEIPSDKKLDIIKTNDSTKKSSLIQQDKEKKDSKSDESPKVKYKAKLEDVKKPVIQKRDTKTLEIKSAKSKPDKSLESESNDDDDDNDDVLNDDDDEDDDDENYEGLENIEELFKILHIEKKPDTKKKQENKGIKNKVQTENNRTNPIIKIEFDNNDDDDDDKDNDKDEKYIKIDLMKPSTKIINSDFKSDTEPTKKLISENEEKVPAKDHKTQIEPKSDHPKKKNEPVLKENKRAIKKIEETNIKVDSKKIELSKNEEKVSEKSYPNKKLTLLEKNLDSDETELKPKTSDGKTKIDSSKKVKGTEHIATKQKSYEKGSDDFKKPELEKLLKDIKPDKKEVARKEKKIDNDKSEEKQEIIKKHVPEPKSKASNSKESREYLDDREDKIELENIQLLTKIREKHSNEKLYDSEDTSSSHMKHVTEALHRRNLLKSEFEDFYSFFPTFAPNFSRIHNSECRRHGQIVLRQLRGTKLWALNMLDATAKIPSGVLQGNGIQLGDFDQCIGSRARVKLDSGSVVKVQGKYCLARLDVKAEHPELETPVYLAQAKSLIRSKIDDPGHFVPRFSTLSWGTCVPSTCNPEDVEVILKDAVKHYQHTSGVIVRVKVDEEDCYTDDGDYWEKWLELPTILTLSFYGIIVMLVLVATIQDFLAKKPAESSSEQADDKAECDQETEDGEGKKSNTEKTSESLLRSFSLYYTMGKLTASGTSDEIACIHGIRGVATLALLVAHKFLPVAVMPFTNRVKIAELASSPVWSWCRAGWIYTDCFLLLSGVLTAHRIASDGNTGALRRLFSRYMRLSPALLAVVLFYAYVWDKLSTGPMWGTFVTKNAEVCQEGWWWNMLYVQNYFGFEDMCAPQTHQLALDMQLTILGGVVVWLAQSGQGLAKLILPGMHIGAAYLRYTTVRDHRLTLLAYHGVSVSQLYRTARLSYMSTIHRCTPYLIGISLGLLLKKPSKHGKIVLCLGWLSSGVLMALVLWAGLDSGSTQYRYQATLAAQYAAFAPIASALSFAWVIYAVHNGTTEYLSQLLCCRPLVLISRLSYAMYLCQFIIFITNIGTVKTSKEFTLTSLIDFHEMSAILLSSTILTLTFVIPMQSLHKVFTFQFILETPKKTEEEIVQSELKEEEEKSQKVEEPIISPEFIEPPTRSRQNFLAHREVLEEIPETEVEYETQRANNNGLDEILEEEEEGTFGEEDSLENLDDLEIIEEEEIAEDEEGEPGDRSYSRNNDRDLDEWEITTNSRTGAQYYRYTR